MISILNVKSFIWKLYIYTLIKYIPFRHKRLVRKAKKKTKLKVAFFIQVSSSWKYDNIFKLFLNDSKFDPIVVISPLIDQDREIMFKEMDRALEFFSNQNYPVMNSWDEKTQRWLDIKEMIKPDIVFFSNPWEGMSRPEYYIYNFLDTLTFYVPYGFKSSYLYEAIFDKPFQNLLWKISYETKIHKELAYKHARNKGINGLVTGYPGMDSLIDESYVAKDVWKISDKSIKRIIWAPHHSILGKMDSNVGFATFLRYYETMLTIAQKFENEIQLSFKPHPLLRPKLYKHSEWGKERTDLYFDKWSSLPNTQLNESNYIDLFLTSDAIINDGESFLVEYLYTNKPAMFLVADEKVTDRFNEFGKMTFEKLYHGHSEADIHSFISDVVVKGRDYMAEQRIKFFEDFVKPPNNMLASENIFNYIKSSLTQ